MGSYDEQLEAAQAEARARKAKAESDVAGAELEQQLLTRINDLKDKMAEGNAYMQELADSSDDKVDELKAKIGKFFS